MDHLLVAYAACALAVAPAPGPNPLKDYIPFFESYWLWKTIGFAGIGIFGTRFLVQWLYSEKHRESRVPPIFWWQSLIGTFLCLAYFVRQWDSVGMAGYLLNVIPYTRNLMLIYGKRRQQITAGSDVPQQTERQLR